MIIGISGSVEGNSGFAVVNRHLARSFQDLGHVVRTLPRFFWRAYRYTAGISPPDFWTGCEWQVCSRGIRGTHIPYVVNEVSEVWAVNRDAANRAMGLVATCSFTEEVYRRAGINRIVAVPLGVDCSVYHPEVPPADLPTEKSVKFMMLQVFNSRSGADIAVRAFVKAFSGSDDASLILRDFTVRPQVAEFIDFCRSGKSDPPEILYLAGEFDDEEHAGWYTACDVFLSPNRGAAPGMTVLEAMACGKPVIANTWSGLSDYVNGDNGWLLHYDLIPVRFNATKLNALGFTNYLPVSGYVNEPVLWSETDVNDMAEKMREAYEDPDQRGRKGEAAYCSMAGRTWERTAREFLGSVSDWIA